jgi:predicted MFS family arabinose efflux permease
VIAAVSGLVFAATYRTSPPMPTSDGIPLRTLFVSRMFHVTMLAGGAMVAIQFVILAHLMVYLRDSRDIPLSRGAWILMAVQLGGVAGRVLLAMWSDHARRTRLEQVGVSLLGALVGAVALPLLPVGTGYGVLWLFAVVWGFFAFGWYGPWVVHVAEAAPRRGVGTTLGVAMTGNQVAIVAAPPIFGLIIDLTGSYVTMWVVLAGFLAAVLVVLWLNALRPTAAV